MNIRLPPAVIRLGAREIGRRVLNPALPWEVQRRRLNRLVGSWPLPRGTSVTKAALNGVHAEVVAVGQPGSGAAGQAAGPGGGTAVATVVHFHGGGYCVGSPAEARSWAARLSARSGCRVVLPDYRLAPEHPFPAALDDARAVTKALAGEVGLDRLVLSGDSAGAGLALALLLAMRADGEELPGGCILLSPWLDLGRDRRADADLLRREVMLSPGWLDACGRAYADPAAWTEPLVSPLQAESAGLPPLLIQTGTDDLLAADAEVLAAAAAAAGVDVSYTRWPRMWHDFALQPGLLAAADSALAQAAWFVGRIRGEASG
jgi:epsilon-lactone hydrolase